MARLITDDALAIVTMWQEARGEDIFGKIAVGEVILNRMRTRTHSDGTVAGTVLRDRQFSGWNSSDPNRIPSALADDSHPVVQEIIRAWQSAKNGSTFAKGATFYVNLNIVKPAWLPEMREVAKIGDHTFFVRKT